MARIVDSCELSVICPNENLKREFEQAIAPHWMLNVSRTLDAYPSAEDLRRVVRAWAPEIVSWILRARPWRNYFARARGRVPGDPAGGDSFVAGCRRYCGRFCTCT